MTVDSVFKKIDRYLKNDSIGSLVVDVQNNRTLEALVTRYQSPKNTFLAASDKDFCNYDEFPKTDVIFDRLQKENKTFFVRELSSFCLLLGEKALSEMLKEVLSLNVAGHAVFITWQCGYYLRDLIRSDSRAENRICITDGNAAVMPKLVFTVKGINLGTDTNIIGIDRIAQAVESELAETIFVETEKSRDSYPLSVYIVSDKKDPYDILCEKDHLTRRLDRDMGSEEDWQYAAAEFIRYPSWELLIDAKIGNARGLNSAIFGYKDHKADKKWLWLYVVGLKLFGAGEDRCLNMAARNTRSQYDFIKNIYRSILELTPDNKEFADTYAQRKAILNAIGNPDDEAAAFCNIVTCKERDAIYYLTDNTVKERELIFKLLDKYGLEYNRSELSDILETVYPDLCCYLEPYDFKNEFLNQYFDDYKYQKLINKILPEFMTVVEQQAVKRDYNTILKPRSSVTEEIDRENSQAYFTDAMGVEYLGFILAKCRKLSLIAKVTVCRCELPSITVRNKEFFKLFSTEQYPIKTVGELDEIKHHGEDKCDYTPTKEPIYLMKELEIIDRLLNNIKTDLTQGNTYSKAILISDHGASRLAVIHDTENLLEMTESGNHSGRCCPKSAADEKPENAVDADDFWTLANYDRFKGSRKAN
ncbi:MAG: BREX-4 system phosphatase PglZ, partial [Clostridiales bacterium]|nr:BREX-4 system phosphatase PglZ [Clostridiales bacterium]